MDHALCPKWRRNQMSTNDGLKDLITAELVKNPLRGIKGSQENCFLDKREVYD